MLRLRAFKADPAAQCITAPISAWAAAVWDDKVGQDSLLRAWRRQVLRLGGGGGSWHRVIGPVGSTLMQAKSIGWQWPSWHTSLSRESMRVDMRHTCPHDVRAIAMRDCEHEQCMQWTRHPSGERLQLEPRPFMAPVQRWFARHGGARASVAAQALCKGRWTQGRSFAAGASSHGHCLLCLRRGAECAGTVAHRIHSCPDFGAEREKAPCLWSRLKETSVNRLLWDRALIADPSARYAFAPQPPLPSWVANDGDDVAGSGAVAAQAVFEGDVATDGSKVGSWPDTARTGFAVAHLNDDGDGVDAALFGPMPIEMAVQRRIARAELCAVWQALVHSCPPVRIHVDCNLVLHGIAYGRRWCEHSSRPHADMWRSIWSRVEDLGIGELGAIFFQVAAHMARANQAELPEAQRRIVAASVHVDFFAKQGGTQGTSAFLTYVNQALDADADKIQHVFGRIGRLGEDVLSSRGEWGDVEPRPRKAVDKRSQPTPRLATVSLLTRKRLLAPLWGGGGGVQRTVCRRFARRVATIAACRLQACVGHAVARAAIAARSLSAEAEHKGARVVEDGHFGMVFAMRGPRGEDCAQPAQRVQRLPVLEVPTRQPGGGAPCRRRQEICPDRQAQAAHRCRMARLGQWTRRLRRVARALRGRGQRRDRLVSRALTVVRQDSETAVKQVRELSFDRRETG